MASVLSHPAVPLALAVAFGSKRVPAALTAAACAASILPDADAIGYAAGIPYDHVFGHRGFTHSIVFALLVALVGAGAAFSERLGASRPTVFAMLLGAAASHGILDAMTTGGLGVAFFSPISNARYFFPWRVIEVSPIGIVPFLSARGLAVVASELRWIWAPAAAVAVVGAASRRFAANAHV